MKAISIDINDSGTYNTQIPSANPSLRFSLFPVVDKSIDLADHVAFEEYYERRTSDSAPFMWELQQSSATFDYFRCAKSPMMPGASCFWDVVRYPVAGVVYFVDPHFERQQLARLYALARELEQSPERVVRELIVVTNSAGRDADACRMDYMRDNLDETGLWKYVTVRLYIMDGDGAQEMHDRFVLLNNHIWHFGSSAGGMHDSLTAFSGPWKDKNGRFKDLVQDIISHHTIRTASSSKGD